MQSDPLAEKALQILVRQAQEGDTEAFEQIYNQFFTPIYRYTAFRTSADVVEDVVADVFVKAWEKLHQYRAQKGVPFGAWLFRIARHTIIDVYRSHEERDEVSEELADPDIWNRADTHLQRNDQVRVVREAINQLPRRYREILLLCYVAELPHSEVARVLRLTEGAIRILKMRALRKLEALLPPELRKRA